MQQVPGISVKVATSPHGLGLHASTDILAGSSVITFTGQVLCLDDVLASDRDECYPMQIGRLTYLDLDGPCRLINHNCLPNAGLRSDRILIALRNIKAGEEICYDYSTTMSERRWSMQCRCGAPNCRGTIADFHNLPAALQEHYLQLGIVQCFIVQEVWARERVQERSER